MLKILKKKRTLKEVKIAKGSESLVVLPCVLTSCKNGVETQVYNIVGYINYGNIRKFIYLERNHDRLSLSAKSVRVPMNESEGLIERGYCRVENDEYTLKKI